MAEWKYIDYRELINQVFMMLEGCQTCCCEAAMAVLATGALAIALALYKCCTKKRGTQSEIERLQQEREEANRWLEEADRTIRKLQQEKTELQNRYDVLTNRLSKTASEKMRKDNPIVENLNDPHRPTALASKWASLFRCGEYWTAFENMKAVSEEADIVSVLHRVCRLTYETTKAYVQDLLEELTARLADQDVSDDGPTSDSYGHPGTERHDIERFFSHKDERESFLDSLRSLRARHQQDDARGDIKARGLVEKLLKSKPPPASLIQEVDRVLQQEVSLDPSLVKSFTDQLVQLIYYMRAQEIPLMLDFQGSEGTPFDPVLYDYERSAAAAADPRSLVIKNVLRPAVLRNEPGPVLSKGEIEVMSRSQWNSLKNKKAEASPVQDEAAVDKTSTSTTDPGKVTHSNADEVHDIGASNVAPQEKEPPADPEKSAENDHASRHPQDQLTVDLEPGPDQQGDDMPINATSEASPAAQGEEGAGETTVPSLQATTRQPEGEGDPAGTRDTDADLGSASGTSDVEVTKENLSASMETSALEPDVQPKIPDSEANTGSENLSASTETSALEPDVQPKIPDNEGNAGSENLSASTETSALEPDVQPKIPNNEGDAGSGSVNETANEQTAEAGKEGGRGSGEPGSEATPSPL